MTSGKRRAWTRDELILAINLYCQIPFGTIHERNPRIIDLAKQLDRTPGSISYKLANFASIDPSLQRKGATNISKLDREVWSEFFEDWAGMAFESEIRAAQKRIEPLNSKDDESNQEGRSREALVKIRVNQGFFRRMVLSSYNESCCITGLTVPGLLVAGHIVPWSIDTRNRMNPRNGLCLNALHDKAFDLGLISIDESYRVLISSEIRNLPEASVGILTKYEGDRITMPSRFVPDQTLLEFHRKQVFRP